MGAVFTSVRVNFPGSLLGIETIRQFIPQAIKSISCKICDGLFRAYVRAVVELICDGLFRAYDRAVVELICDGLFRAYARAVVELICDGFPIKYYSSVSGGLRETKAAI